jgi:hypothetical protein
MVGFSHHPGEVGGGLVKIPAIMMIDEGAEWPRRWGWPWGLAWRNGDLHAVVLPVPLNLVAGAVRWWYFTILHGIKPHKLDLARKLAERYRLAATKYERADRASRALLATETRHRKHILGEIVAVEKERDYLRGLLRIAGINPEPPKEQIQEEEVSCPP